MPAVAHTAPAFVRANGIDLCYDSFGDAHAPPLLLIMGLGAQMILWDDEFCASLAGRIQSRLCENALNGCCDRVMFGNATLGEPHEAIHRG